MREKVWRNAKQHTPCCRCPCMRLRRECGFNWLWCIMVKNKPQRVSRYHNILKAVIGSTQNRRRCKEWVPLQPLCVCSKEFFWILVFSGEAKISRTSGSNKTENLPYRHILAIFSKLFGVFCHCYRHASFFPVYTLCEFPATYTFHFWVEYDKYDMILAVGST